MSKTKNILLIALSALSALIASSCSSDDLTGSEMTGVPSTVTLSFQTPDMTKAGDTESDLQTIRIYAFHNDKVVATIYDGNVTKNTYTMQVPTGQVTFYAIANEAAAGALKSKNTDAFTFPEADNQQALDLLTPAKLDEVTFSTLPAANIIPMTSIALNSEINGTSNAITMQLSRSVAKMSLYFAKKTGGTSKIYLNHGISLYNIPQFGYLFPKAYDGTMNFTDNRLPGQSLLQDIPTNSLSNELINDLPTPDPDPTKYQQLPAKSIYLFANPNEDTAIDCYELLVKWTEVNGSERFNSNKLLPIPTVAANDHVQLFALIGDKFTSTEALWFVINPWIEAGGNIEFN